MKKLTRIVTFMGYPSYGTPQQMLECGSNTYQLGDKIRLFAVRHVAYDDGMTPLYTIPIPIEHTCQSLDELHNYNANVRLYDAPVLDVDNHLKVYNDEIRDN